MVLYVRSCCDNTMSKFLPVYMDIPCRIYVVKMFRSPYFKWLAKVCWI
jgi:hypothetical protein